MITTKMQIVIVRKYLCKGKISQGKKHSPVYRWHGIRRKQVSGLQYNWIYGKVSGVDRL